MTQMKNVCGALLLWALCSLPAQAVCHWPEWDHFRQHYISEEGRVIDPAEGRRITTSEGQSYALFFALVNDDRETFARLLDWTERQLARGDLTGFLPSWLWGRQQDGNWGVLDANSASDSDLWIAYSLLEAGRLWDNHSYSALGTLLLRRIAREEVATLPGLGPVLLPGVKAMRGREAGPSIPAICLHNCWPDSPPSRGPGGRCGPSCPNCCRRVRPVALPRTGWIGRGRRGGR